MYLALKLHFFAEKIKKKISFFKFTLHLKVLDDKFPT